MVFIWIALLARTLLGRHRLSARALVMTATLLIAMAAPAMIGLSRPKAASGRPKTLNRNAQTRFCRILAVVAREVDGRRHQAGSPRNRAIPRFDGDVGAGRHGDADIRRRRAGASLIPSPTMRRSRLRFSIDQ